MNLMMKSSQNLSSFPKSPATGPDRGAAPWAHGLYPEQLSPPPPIPTPPHPAWPRAWTTRANPQVPGRKQVGASFLPVTPETSQVPSSALKSILSGIPFRGPINFKARVEEKPVSF